MDHSPEIEALLVAIKLELSYKTTRSSGPGGQHVNKTETRVEAYWDMASSVLIDDETKALFTEKLSNHLDKEGVLRATSQETRSQGTNKELATEKLLERVAKALEKPKPRKKRKRSKASIEDRLKHKKQLSQKKQLRKPPTLD